jgi:hypothetical protein
MACAAARPGVVRGGDAVEDSTDLDSTALAELAALAANHNAPQRAKTGRDQSRVFMMVKPAPSGGGVKWEICSKV